MYVDDSFDPQKIRKCEILEKDGMPYVQFIATGDKHKLVKKDNGQVGIITLPEQGTNYRYYLPFTVENALNILDAGYHPCHRTLATEIREYMGMA